ncbi:MAG: penicillin-binding protein activator LpoB [Gammaproteobacteria bacterium]|nr:penicillin-binding protein activator LpoB [Gammaproteobacteria bacterium]
MKMNKIIMACVVAIFITGVSGCGGGVKRVDVTQEHALTDRWNSTDSRLVAEEMVADMLSFPWITKFKAASLGKDPVITIQRVTNKSHEHIAVDAFINDIKRALLRSGRAEFIVSSKERDRVRDEIKQQDLYASEETRLEMGEETGANFALSGSIHSMVDQLDDKRVTSYQIDLKLIDIRTTKEVWNGKKKIKKLFKRSSYGF